MYYNNLKKRLKPQNVREKILIAETDLINLNKQLDGYDGQIKDLENKKDCIKRKITKKTIYKLNLQREV